MSDAAGENGATVIFPLLPSSGSESTDLNCRCLDFLAFVVEGF